MRHGWNQQSAFWKKADADKRTKELKKRGQKAKITKKLDKETGRPIYHVWMWWKWKD